MASLFDSGSLNGLLNANKFLEDTVIDLFGKWVGTQRIDALIRCVPISFWYLMFPKEEAQPFSHCDHKKKERVLRKLKEHLATDTDTVLWPICRWAMKVFLINDCANCNAENFITSCSYSSSSQSRR
jgi:hypothetical protein